MKNAGEHAVYFVSEEKDLDTALDAAEFIGNERAAFAYIADNKLEATHQVFRVSTTTNPLSIWTGDE